MENFEKNIGKPNISQTSPYGKGNGKFEPQVKSKNNFDAAERIQNRESWELNTPQEIENDSEISSDNRSKEIK